MHAWGSQYAVDNAGDSGNASQYGGFQPPRRFNDRPPPLLALPDSMDTRNTSISSSAVNSSSSSSSSSNYAVPPPFAWDSPDRVSTRKRRRVLETETPSQEMESKSYATQEQPPSAEELFPADGRSHTAHEPSYGAGVDMLQMRLNDAQESLGAESASVATITIDLSNFEARVQAAVRAQFGDVIAQKDKRIKFFEDANADIQRRHDKVVEELGAARVANSTLTNSLTSVRDALATSQANLSNVTAELSQERARFQNSDAKRLLDERAELQRQLEEAKKDLERRSGEHLDRLSTTQLDDLRAQCRQALDNVDAECVQRRQCVICMDARAQVVVMPCWHMCMCEGCLEDLKSDTPSGERRCPKCRAFITAFNTPYMN